MRRTLSVRTACVIGVSCAVAGVLGTVLLRHLAPQKRPPDHPHAERQAGGRQTGGVPAPRKGVVKLPRLAEAERRAVWQDMVQAVAKAERQAIEEHPVLPEEGLKPGNTLRLSKETPLVPILDFHKGTLLLPDIPRLPAGTIMTVVSRVVKFPNTQYKVRAKTPSGGGDRVGWIYAMALKGQVGTGTKEEIRNRVQRSAEVEQRMYEKLKHEVARRHGLTADQAEAIYLEEEAKRVGMSVE